jgi:uncharacterized protein (TIGR00369 family)
MTIAEIDALLEREFPQLSAGGRVYFLDAVRPGEAVLRLEANDSHLRPGGTVSGPAMMALADLASYAVILAHVGPVALAVTTSLNINFLRKPHPGPLVATARLLKLGKRLAVADCAIASPGMEGLVAHASVTYSIPTL